ncbi:probable cyclin-dependent serine/threonine-protein kinase DDB_G0292550 isoform X1 [Hylaeus volcanicus]|uniref:probable cyclin-dependent serine/threonine-protein kinase DDB_G0292550 isoform X1 n=1 Tax=Hylaeus volcanicus TaxID=313075 RepID=UPI0023B7E51B|nr:probable cyclin-dependent serine/threonine-protein kinase DDB_G0292550 isoform X1 [Hylaeus volcanicus]
MCNNNNENSNNFNKTFEPLNSSTLEPTECIYSWAHLDAFSPKYDNSRADRASYNLDDFSNNSCGLDHFNSIFQSDSKPETIYNETFLNDHDSLDEKPFNKNQSSKKLYNNKTTISTDFLSPKYITSPRWSSETALSIHSLKFSVPLTKSLDDFHYASYPTPSSVFKLNRLSDVTTKSIEASHQWNPVSDGFSEKFNHPTSLSLNDSDFTALCHDTLAFKNNDIESSSTLCCNSTPHLSDISKSDFTMDVISTPNILSNTHKFLDVHDNRKDKDTLINKVFSQNQNNLPSIFCNATSNKLSESFLSDCFKNLQKKKMEKTTTKDQWIPMQETLVCPTEQVKNATIIFHVADARRHNITQASLQKNQFLERETHVRPTNDSSTSPILASSSIGIHPHSCKPCAFFWTKGCVNGNTCQFCHAQHNPKKKKSIEDQKNLLIIARPDGRIEYLRCNVNEALSRC